MIKIERYSSNKEDIWNDFNRNSKNGLFLFDRRYMDYHSNRFKDHSLLFYNNEKLIALLPLSEHCSELRSHGGLTYGGFITDSRMKQHIMNDCFSALASYALDNSFDSIIYKCVPHLYHKQPAEEDRFSLYANGAMLETVDVSTVVNLTSQLKMTKGRKAQISRAKREGVYIEERCELTDFEIFIDLENRVLEDKHGVKAVHTGKELKLLHDKFPDKIHLFVASKDNIVIAGTVVYEYEQAIHTQYMAADENARTIGALDLTIRTIMNKYQNSKLWLDFGISTEHGKIYLNEGLCSQKEGFGGRTNVYEIWKVLFK